MQPVASNGQGWHVITSIRPHERGGTREGMATQDSAPDSSHSNVKPRFLNRGARLGISLSGTNLERAADYNQRTVLQAIRVSGEASRSILAAITGLTAPTIANIARRLLDAGLIREAGRRQGPRGSQLPNL
jgi:hypothetical protein